MLLAVPTQAAARYKKQWKKQNQNIYYYNEKGKKFTGLSKIGKKTFYFDKKGAQHVGWQKIGNDYYYFNIARGSNGSMVKSAKVNGITIDRTGKAKKDSASLRRLRILLAANQTVERITKPLMPSTSTHASGEDVMTGSLPDAADTAGETVKRLKNPARA